MLLNDFIFTSYCFDNEAAGGDYHAQQLRLEESIRMIYPKPNLHFLYESEEIGKPKFQQSLYGFKVQLVKTCLSKGFKKIIFFDTSICLVDTVDYWFEQAKKYGILCAVDRQTLNNVTSDQCLKHLGISRDSVKDWNLVGGSIYVFDFNQPITYRIFTQWANLEAAGMFGTQDELTAGKLQGHRMDETCMGLSLRLNGMAPLGHDIMKYAYEKPGDPGQLHTMGDGDYKPIVIKRHFK